MGTPATLMQQSQSQMYYAAAEKAARADQTFLELVRSGMTKADLKRNIEQRPSLWKKYEHWLDKLPEHRAEHRIQKEAS